MKPKQTTKSDCHHQDRAILLTRSDAKHLASQHTTGSPRSQTRISPSRTRNGYSLQVTPIPCSPRTGATSRFHFTSGSRCGYGHTDGVLYDTHRLLKRVHLSPVFTSGSRCGYGHTDGVLYDTHRLLKRVHLSLQMGLGTDT